MKLIPTSRQWTRWGLPSKVSYIGFVLAIIGVPLWVISYFWPPQPDFLSDQPQLSIETTAKPYLRYSRMPDGGVELSYELCIRNSGRNPARGLKYTKATQALQIGAERPIVVDSRPSLRVPKRLVSGERYCQIFTMRNSKEDPAQITKLVDRYNAGEVTISLELNMTYVDALTEKKYSFEERNKVKIDRVNIE